MSSHYFPKERRVVALVVFFVAIRWVYVSGSGDVSEQDPEDVALQKEMQDYPAFALSTRKRFDDFVDAEDADAEEDEDKGVDDEWNEALKNVDPKFTGLEPQTNAYRKYLSQLYHDYMRKGNDPSTAQNTPGGVYPASLLLNGNRDFPIAPISNNNQFAPSLVENQRQIPRQVGYGSSVIDMGRNMWFGRSAVASGLRHNVASFLEENAAVRPSSLRFSETRHHLRGGTQRRLLVTDKDIDAGLMTPVQHLEQSALFDVVVNGGERPKVDGLGCHPLCLPNAALPDDKTSDFTQFTMPDANPQYAIGLNPTSAAKILTYPERLPGAAELVPSYYSEKNKDYMFRQPDPNSPYDQIALYSSSPYRSMGNPPAVGDDKKGGFWPMVQVGVSHAPVAGPTWRPPLDSVHLGSAIDRSPTRAFETTSYANRIAQQHYSDIVSTYPNMEYLRSKRRPAKDSDLEKITGIESSKRTKYGKNPAKVESFLELSSKQTSKQRGVSGVFKQYKWWPTYDYSWLRSPDMHAAIRGAGSPRGVVTGKAESQDMMRLPENFLHAQIGDPPSLGPPSDPPPTSLMGYGFF
eukprot:g3146.t1